ncbi:hypothetical protein MRX96_011563 [Rhipicephalus microplus]
MWSKHTTDGVPRVRSLVRFQFLICLVPHCSHCWPATVSTEMPWDANRSHHDVKPDAIPIPHGERHNIIETKRTSGAAADHKRGSSEKNKHDPGPTPPTNDMSAMKEPQQGHSGQNRPALPHSDSQNSTDEENMTKWRKHLCANKKLCRQGRQALLAVRSTGSLSATVQPLLVCYCLNRDAMGCQQKPP